MRRGGARRRCAAAACLAWAWTWTCAAGAAEAPLVVGVEAIEYLPAYNYRDGRYGGFARAVLDAFAADSKRPIEYVALPVSRLYEDFLPRRSAP